MWLCELSLNVCNYTNMFAFGYGLTKFNGMNCVEWSEQIQFQLGVMDLDLY